MLVGLFVRINRPQIPKVKSRIKGLMEENASDLFGDM